MTIVQRIVMLLSASLLAVLAVGGYGLWEQQQAKHRFDDALGNLIPSVRDLNKATSGFIDMRSGIIRHVLASRPEDKRAAEDMVKQADQVLDSAFDTYGKSDVYDERDRKLLNEDLRALAQLREARQKLFAISNTNDIAATNKEFVSGAIGVSTKEFRKAIDAHVDFNMQVAAEIQKANEAASQRTLWMMAGFIALVVALVALLGGQVLSVIRRGLAQIQDTIQLVSAQLDFTRRAPVARMDEIGVTASAFNDLLGRLQQNLGAILSGAQEVAGASQALNQTAEQVATAAASQSSSSANVAATIEQMTVSVNHVADRAQETHSLASSAGTMAMEGSTTISQTINDIRQISRAVDEAAGSIRELEKFSGQVNAVVSVIKDIADQTNLLALNASIEAARAGEMGRGFAVVADEVRMLAERTTSSTQEISSTLSAMQERSRQASTQMQTAEDLVKNSVERADDADTAIRQIGGATGDTVRMVSEISAAIKEQGSATNNIAVQVESIAQMSEEASSAAQETASSAQQLDRLAKEQIATLSQYRL